MPVNNNLAGTLPAKAGFGLGYVHPSPVALPGAPYPYTADGYEQVLAEKRAAEQREERMWRQRYAESAFDNAAKSPAGAVGAFQIMPITYKDYLERGKGKPGDLTDPAYNRKVRDFVLGIIPRDLGSLWSKESPEEINLAKRYAAYNWGSGSLRSYLRKKQKEGIDIHNSLDWMAGLPKETRDYVNFIVFNQDVPNTSKMADLYQAAREKYNFETGGRLRKLVQRINETSNADFVKRLLDEKRAVLKNDDGTVSTHELGYVTEGDRAVVFPFVQSTDNGLVRFTMPDALNRAVERGDTLQMSVPEAELFTKKYKKYYPGFHSYDGKSEPTGHIFCASGRRLFGDGGKEETNSTQYKPEYNPVMDTTTQLNDDPYVQEYFKYDVAPRYLREHGWTTEKELNVLNNAYGNTKSFISSNDAYEMGSANFHPNTIVTGIPITGPLNKIFGEEPYIKYSKNYGDPRRSNIVHENTHILRQQGISKASLISGGANHLISGVPPIIGTIDSSGYNKTETDYLNNAYDLSNFDLGVKPGIWHNTNKRYREVIESGATNTELRYVLWRELYTKLGRRPTLEEFDEYINNYDEEQLMYMLRLENGYGYESGKKQPEAQPVKDALIHVADANTGYIIDPNIAAFGGSLKKYYPGFNKYDGNTKPTGQMMLIGEDGNPIDVLPGAVTTYNILSDYNRRQVKRLARNDYANVGEKTREFDQDWQTKVYNRAWDRADRRYRNQENRKALRRAAIQELQTGVHTGAFNEYTKEGIEDMSPFAMGLVLSAAGPALGGLRTVGDLAKATGAAGRGVAKGLEWIGEKAMPSTLLKSPVWRGATARAFQAAAPYADAAALSYWSALAGNTAYNAIRNKDWGTASASGTMALLPLVPAAAGAVGMAKNLFNSAKRLPAEASRAVAEVVPAPARAAGAEWSPEELARLQAMAGTQQMDLAAYTPEQIARAQAQMQADAPIIHDALAGNRATVAAERFISSGPVAGAKMASGYQIERYPGYMLKSLMEGNPLEKQLSKAGEINVDNLRNYMKSKDIKNVDKAVMEKVLASDEFAGKKSIDYNKFRKAVQDELITYERTPDTRWENYGMDRIGVSTVDTDSNWKYWKGLYLEERQNPKTGLWEYFDENGNLVSEEDAREMFLKDALGNRYGDAAPSTYVFSSARIPNGSDKHYDANTIGNVRTYTTADEPEVLHVMESQSDWAQQGKPKGLSELLKTHDIKTVADLDEEIAFQKANAGEGYKGVDWKVELAKLEEARPYVDPETSYLIDNYTTRQIQENLRYAAEKGQKKMRYPTRETAAKIEGYPEVEMYVDERGIKYKNPYEYDQDIRAKLDAVEERFNKVSRSTDDSDMPEYERLAKELNELYHAYVDSAVPRKNVKRVVSYADEHEGILKKYDAFPKQFKKLYKNADVRTVTDSKGNTWYEVDVPENYLKQEWAYADGGLLNRLSMHYSGDTEKIRELISKVRAKQLV